MKERPIIMSDNHPKLILDGIKTQTRRVIKPQPGDKVWQHQFPSGDWDWMSNLSHQYGTSTAHRCPYGQVGDKLWVRETWRPIDADSSFAYYKADSNMEDIKGWHSPYFMSRWASRITLEITEVRVERVQGITLPDLIAEGIPADSSNLANSKELWDTLQAKILGFKKIWDFLNAKRGYGWEVNPWVWVISFKVV